MSEVEAVFPVSNLDSHGTFTYNNPATAAVVTGFFTVVHNTGNAGALRNCVTTVLVI